MQNKRRYDIIPLQTMFFYVDETFVELGVQHHFHIFGTKLFIWTNYRRYVTNIKAKAIRPIWSMFDGHVVFVK